MDMICQFNKLKLPKFQGGANLLKYEERIRRLENLFEITECQELTIPEGNEGFVVLVMHLDKDGDVY